jgi:hypothetical protein
VVALKPDDFDPLVNTSPGEETLFQKLGKTDQAPNWTVLHSLDILHHQSRVQGEADFVVLAPSLGLLVIEVKAHKKVQLKNGSWFLGDDKSKDPYRQASDAAYSIKKYLDSREINTSSLPILHAVWFTNCSTKELPESIEWDDGTTLGVEDLKSDPVDAIKRVFAVGRQRLGKSIRFQEPIADASLLKRVSETLMPNFTIRQLPKDKKLEIEAELARSTNEQLATLELLRDQQHLMVPGMAGTGKTFLALHEAKAAHLRGEESLLICFNRMLAGQLSKELAEFPRVTVKTVHSLLLEAAGNPDASGKSDEWWSTELPALAESALLAGAEIHKFETLIIDEGQDVGTDSYLELLDLVLHGGFSGSKVRIFGDFRNQAIYLDGLEARVNFERHLEKLFVAAELQINCRNTRNLGEFLNNFLELKPAYSGFRRTDRGEIVDTYHLADPLDFSKTLTNVVDGLLKVYSANDIVILSSNLKKLEAAVEKSDLKCSKIDVLNTGRVRFGSIHKFKGLEALAVVLVDFPGSTISTRDTFYQAATRATSKFAYLITDERLEEL